MKIVKQLYTCFIFGEGRSDIKFVTKLIEHPKFGYHTKKWSFNYDNASGSSVETIVKQCHQAILSRDYNLVLCILDVDQLKHLFGSKWEKEKLIIEKKYPKIKLIWQLDNLEDEIKKVLGDISVGKYRLSRLAIQKINKFVNSNYWKQILSVIKQEESRLEKSNNKVH